MSTRTVGTNTALLVVDVQNAVVAQAHERDETVRVIAELVERARRENVPVVWIQHHDDQLAKGSLDWQIVPELSPTGDEVIVHKSYNDAFEETDLEEHLDRLGVGSLVVTGAQTEWCIRSTLHGAIARGYDAL
ncbi:MAG: isochorismatase family protein, partial [Actinomycetota bacterium]